MDAREKFLLFRRTKYFCSVPWNLLYVDTNGDIKTCTRGKVIGSSRANSIPELLSESRMQNLKTEILQDKITPNCEHCIRLENHGDGNQRYHYLRNMYNKLFQDQDVDYHDTDVFKLGAVDLHWSSLCDLQCVTCWAKQSSSIAVAQNLPVSHTPTAVANTIIDFIVDNQDTIREIYFSGGEPTLIKYNLNLLQRVKKRHDLLIRVNSNMMWQQDNAILEQILQFPRVIFTCSADNTGEKFEWIRRGAGWARFIENLRYLKRYPNVDIRINSIFFVLSALDLKATIDYFFKEHEINDFTINQCEMGHTYFRCRNLSQATKEKLNHDISQIKKDYEHNLNLIGCLNNCLDEIALRDDEDFRSKLDCIAMPNGTSWRALWQELT